jgi:hypothetical protein
MSHHEYGRHARPARNHKGQIIISVVVNATATIVGTVLAAVLVHPSPSPPVHTVHSSRITNVINNYECGSPPMRRRPARR